MPDLSAANLISGVIFGSIGFMAFVYGKKMASFKPMLIGIALMVFPYFVANTWAQYAIGSALTVSLYFFRD